MNRPDSTTRSSDGSRADANLCLVKIPRNAGTRGIACMGAGAPMQAEAQNTRTESTMLGLPQPKVIHAPFDERRMNHWPDENRKTATSARPSPS